ncbi:HAD superfamily hydrolase [Nitritalea halalkaliphila LW7]|uniref:HAD superfamily hydrolase n=1 Tax=Nitritalea halalkaliphila LW7 TaxID=1189621 RepID=I5CAI5_9BACT|nr:HAD family phosphatase [Nitritalea halalkaliphila]EIM78837.1 HAD superfamily hydrolase [Nitritalea halalkaliphila LW7]
MARLTGIQFLLFDLGNVIIDIDYEHTIGQLKALLPVEKHERCASFFPSSFHKAYERGEISDAEFRQAVRLHFEENWSDEQIDTLWNSLLFDIPADRIRLVKKLKQNFTLGVLSNTNAIHIRAFNAILQEQHGYENLHELFDYVYFSHELGLSKPDPKIYQTVAEKTGFTPEQTFFFDDLEANIHEAKQVGFQAHQIKDKNALTRFFDENLFN